mgnify:CR=1 FL=1
MMGVHVYHMQALGAPCCGVLRTVLTWHISCDVVCRIAPGKEPARTMQVCCCSSKLHTVILIPQVEPWEAPHGTRVLHGVICQVHGVRGSCRLGAEKVSICLLQ